MSDAAWDELLDGFRRQFWQQRVTAFAAAWEICSGQSAASWGMDLKLAIHGLAGVAALVDLPDLGDAARRIESLWDEQGSASEALRRDIDALLAQLLAAR